MTNLDPKMLRSVLVCLLACIASAGSGVAPLSAVEPPQGNASLFETSIAPILSKHCLECHDTLTKKGKLDLSHKATAFAGGAHGPPIIPGTPVESLLWKKIESDEMPRDRNR